MMQFHCTNLRNADEECESEFFRSVHIEIHSMHFMFLLIFSMSFSQLDSVAFVVWQPVRHEEEMERKRDWASITATVLFFVINLITCFGFAVICPGDSPTPRGRFTEPGEQKNWNAYETS
jgi:hypothetical protein